MRGLAIDVKKQRPIDDLHVALAPYVRLLQAYIAHEMDPGTFRDRYFALTEEDNEPVSPDVFYSLDEFFAAVDETVVDPDLRTGDPYELSPEELRDRAVALLEEGGFTVTGDPEADEPSAVDSEAPDPGEHTTKS